MNGTVFSGLRVRARCSRPIPLDVEMYCPEGKTMAIVGPSGCGKSTLLRLVAGLHRIPDAQVSCCGEVWQDGRYWTAPHRRAVGMVFQHYALFPHYSVLKNVLAAQGSDGVSAQELIAQVGLGGLEDRLPHELSGGQRQRVALARALARRPAVLLLDEPFSAVDGPMRRSLHRTLHEVLATMEVPCLFVTHDIGEVWALAHLVAVMDAGEILQCDTPQKVLRAPKNIRVAEVLGLSNVFSATIYANEDKHSILDAG